MGKNKKLNPLEQMLHDKLKNSVDSWNKKLDERDSRKYQKSLQYDKNKKKINLEFKIAFGFLIAIIIASSIMGVISAHFESKSIKYRNSIIKPDTNSSYENKTTDNSCEDEALGEFEANHGTIVDNDYEVSAMASILKKHCGY